MVASHPSLQLQELHVLLIEPLTDGRLLVVLIQSPVDNRLLEIKGRIFVSFIEFLAETECGMTMEMTYFSFHFLLGLAPALKPCDLRNSTSLPLMLCFFFTAS